MDKFARVDDKEKIDRVVTDWILEEQPHALLIDRILEIIKQKVEIARINEREKIARFLTEEEKSRWAGKDVKSLRELIHAIRWRGEK